MDPIGIRLAREEDLPRLPEIERAAARAFAPWGLDALFASATTPLEVHRAAIARDHLLVATAGDAVIGFALLSRVDWHAHLDELDVDPAHGRRGVGTALVEHAMAHAARLGFTRMTLGTMREIPFNGPWYVRRFGFRELREDELGPGLRAVLTRELAGGYPIAERVILGRDLRSIA